MFELAELTTLLDALDDYILNRNRADPNDLPLAIELHNRFLREINERFPKHFAGGNYHNFL